MDDTASSVYGFQSYSPAYPGGLAVAQATDVMQQGLPSEVLPSFGLGHRNPLFWILILALIVTGYLTLGFNVGLKKIFKAGAKVG
jgi:hypothetical protein